MRRIIPSVRSDNNSRQIGANARLCLGKDRTPSD